MSLTLSSVLSRTSGVAPLAVHFDATGTTDTETTAPFHDCYYEWDFGDYASGVWEYGAVPGQSKNRATGAVAAHVFETPGTYTVTLTVKSADGVTVQTNSAVVTVDDPDIFYGNANTWYIANTLPVAGQNGVPSGATNLVASSDFDAALTSYRGNSRRILFKRGDSFPISAYVALTQSSMTIGAYGVGPNPTVTGTNISSGLINIANATATDLRVCDLDLIGSGNTDTGASVLVEANISNLLLLRLTSYNVAKGITCTGSNTLTGAVIQECTIRNFYGASGGTAFFGRLLSSAVLGNNLGPSFNEHVLRIQKAQRVAVCNNAMSSPTTTKNTFTLRADVHASAADDTYMVVISNNYIYAGTATTNYGLSLGPSANSENHHLYDILVEGNFLKAGTSTQNIYGISASRVTTRNNLFDVTGATSSIGMSISSGNTAGIPHLDGNCIYNNTFVRFDAPASVNMIYLDATALVNTINTKIRNNLVYAPNTPGTAKCVVIQTPGTYVTGTIGASGTHGNSADAQVKGIDPLFRGSPAGVLLNPHDINIKFASYAKDSGVAAPVHTDFFGRPRDGSMSSGAFTYTTLAPYAQSRIKGVGPLSVFFDAVSSYDAAGTDAFHECVYEWNFGDVGDAMWSYGARLTSKNEAQGAVAAHVYEYPGVYNVTCKITGKDGSVSYLTSQVTVEDPDVVFAGTKTICVSTDGVFTGAPAGCTQVTQSNFKTAMDSYAVGGKRVLFKRSQTFTAAAGTTFAPTSYPSHIGAWGTGALPIIDASVSTSPVLQISSSSTPHCRDIRIADLSIDCANRGTEIGGISGNGGCDDLLIHNVTVQNIRGGLSFYNTTIDQAGYEAHHLWDTLTYSNCTLQNINGGNGYNGTNTTANRFAVLGNKISDTVDAEHGLRIDSTRKCVVSSNLLMDAAVGKTVFTLRSVDYTSASRTIPSGCYTQHAVVSNNVMTPSPVQVGAVGLGVVNSANDQRARDVVFENNWITNSSNPATSVMQIPLAITMWKGVTIRNNLVIHDGNTSDTRFISIECGTGGLNMDNIRVYNNTLYSDMHSVGTNPFGIDFKNVVGCSYTSVSLVNNVMRVQNTASSPMFWFDVGNKTVTSTIMANTINGNIKTVNPFLVGSPSSFNDFRIPSGSYAKGTGYSVPVQRDAYGLPVNTLPDMGAFSYRVVTPQLVATRTSGVGPLAVHFDASDTLDLDTSYPFHECYYEWNFGDPTAGLWSYGAIPGQLKNKATGPIAAHVFETPGDYDVTLTVTSRNGLERRTKTLRVSVQDPDVVFAGKKTVCVTTGASTDGMKSGCLQITNYAGTVTSLVAAYLDTGTRILLKRGESFASSGDATLNKKGPWHVGAYGTGVAPQVISSQGIGASGHVFMVGTGDGVPSVGCIVSDLDVSSSVLNSDKGAIQFLGNSDYFLLHKLNVHNIGDGIFMSIDLLNTAGNNHAWNGWVISECIVSEVGSAGGTHGAMTYGKRSAIMGSYWNDANNSGNTGEHILRANYLDRFVISNNYFGLTAPNKETVALRGVENNPAGPTYLPHILAAPKPSQLVLFTGNHLELSQSQGVMCGPSNSTQVCAFNDWLFEKNHYLNYPGNINQDGCIGTRVARHTIRNEIFDCSGIKYVTLVSAGGASTGTPAASYVWVYHNTLYSNADSYNGQFRVAYAGIGQITGGVNTVDVKNNILYAPLSSSTVEAMGSTGAGNSNLTQSNNSSSVQAKTVNPFEGGIFPASVSQSALNLAQYAVNSGAAVPVHDDFFGRRRNTPDGGAADMGAIETTRLGYKYADTIQGLI